MLSVIYKILAYVSAVVALVIVLLGVVAIDRGGVSLILWGIVGGVVGAPLLPA